LSSNVDIDINNGFLALTVNDFPQQQASEEKEEEEGPLQVVDDDILRSMKEEEEDRRHKVMSVVAVSILLNPIILSVKESRKKDPTGRIVLCGDDGGSPCLGIVLEDRRLFVVVRRCS
jgi:hypothetical protein